MAAERAAAAEKAEKERATVERAVAERAAEKQVATERAAAEKRVAAEKAAAEKAAVDTAIAETAAAEKAAAEKTAEQVQARRAALREQRRTDQQQRLEAAHRRHVRRFMAPPSAAPSADASTAPQPPTSNQPPSRISSVFAQLFSANPEDELPVVGVVSPNPCSTSLGFGLPPLSTSRSSSTCAPRRRSLMDLSSPPPAAISPTPEDDSPLASRQRMFTARLGSSLPDNLPNLIVNDQVSRNQWCGSDTASEARATDVSEPERSLSARRADPDVDDSPQQRRPRRPLRQAPQRPASQEGRVADRSAVPVSLPGVSARLRVDLDLEDGPQQQQGQQRPSSRAVSAKGRAGDTAANLPESARSLGARLGVDPDADDRPQQRERPRRSSWLASDEVGGADRSASDETSPSLGTRVRVNPDL